MSGAEAIALEDGLARAEVRGEAGFALRFAHHSADYARGIGLRTGPMIDGWVLHLQRSYPTGILERIENCWVKKDAEPKARMGSVLEILMLRALALEAQGNRKGALSTLERVLVLAEPEGYVRLFVDEGPSMLALLRQAHARSCVPGYVAKLLAATER